jgi:hypothetical protein
MSSYRYLCTQPDLPPAGERRPYMRQTPMMDADEMTDWLDKMARQGWDFVSYGQKNWTNGTVQDWWVFRRLR